jgi:hypothetical protein
MSHNNDEDYWNSGDYIGCYLLEKIEAVRDDLLNELRQKSSCIHILNLKAKCGLITDEVEAYSQTHTSPSYLAQECSCEAIQIQTSSSHLDAQVFLDIDQSEFEFESSSTAENKLTRKVKIFSCNECRLHFTSDKMLLNHLDSSDHSKKLG